MSTDAETAHAAGEAAARDRRAHYEANVHGQGSAAGDPMPAESTQQPQIIPPEPRSET